MSTVFCHPEQYKELLWAADMLAWGNLSRWRRWITKCPQVTDKKYQDAVDALLTEKDDDFVGLATHIINVHHGRKKNAK